MAPFRSANKEDKAIQGASMNSPGERTETMSPPRLECSRRAPLLRAMAYMAVFLPLLLLAVLARLNPDFNRQETPDWKSAIKLAEAARAKGDLIEAKGLYSRAGRLAGWQDDWSGLLAAACGMRRIDKEVTPYSATYALLLRAMIAAEAKQSRDGMAATARAFAALGAKETSSMVLARVRLEWPEKADAATVYKSDCW